MSRITVLGGTGYAGRAIVAEAARRGHEVVSFSRSLPEERIDGVEYAQGDVADEAALAAAVADADVIVAALAPRGALADAFRDVNRTVARLADAERARLFIVGGFSSLRPAPGADRYVADLSHAPEAIHHELQTVAAVVTDDLPATPESFDWVFVSPAMGFGAHVPGERTGEYRVGDDVAVDPEGGAISGPDYAIGFVDLIESADRHRAHVNLGY